MLQSGGYTRMMLDTIKRWMGRPPAAETADQRVLAAWAKEAGQQLKSVAGSHEGLVVDTTAGWRVEWGVSQRPYFQGRELRFRFDSGVPPDVQILCLTKTLAQSLESDVFQRFTDAMQTQVDNTLPEEMRWLAMHGKVSLSNHPVLGKRFLVLANVEGIAQQWLYGELAAALEAAASSWWTDQLVVVMTVNRGMLTMRMPGEGLTIEQLRMVSALFDLAARQLVLAP